MRGGLGTSCESLRHVNVLVTAHMSKVKLPPSPHWGDECSSEAERDTLVVEVEMGG